MATCLQGPKMLAVEGSPSLIVRKYKIKETSKNKEKSKNKENSTELHRSSREMRGVDLLSYKKGKLRLNTNTLDHIAWKRNGITNNQIQDASANKMSHKPQCQLKGGKPKRAMINCPLINGKNENRKSTL